MGGAVEGLRRLYVSISLQKDYIVRSPTYRPSFSHRPYCPPNLLSTIYALNVFVGPNLACIHVCWFHAEITSAACRRCHDGRISKVIPKLRTFELFQQALRYVLPDLAVYNAQSVVCRKYESGCQVWQSAVPMA
jgi:hypothetical protein